MSRTLRRAERDPFQGAAFARPVVGTTLTILSALVCLLLCMILPLVGPAGSQVVYDGAIGTPIKDMELFRGWGMSQTTMNSIFFLFVVVVGLILSMLAVRSKMLRSKIDGSPLPRASIAICAVCAVLLFALLTGLLKI